jgi:hypothetical protein
MKAQNLGKPGTVLPEEFTFLTTAVSTSSVRLLALKVAKICSRKAESLAHENPASAIAAAYSGIASKIVSAVGKADGKISTDDYNTLTGMIAQYGPEVVIWKLAKIAKKANNRTDSALLSGLFPNSLAKKPVAATPAPAAARPARTYPRF